MPPGQLWLDVEGTHLQPAPGAWLRLADMLACCYVARSNTVCHGIFCQ